MANAEKYEKDISKKEGLLIEKEYSIFGLLNINTLVFIVLTWSFH